MSKHTPGPWITNGDPYVSTGNGNQAIAFCDVRGISKDEAKANARLIAAAPELLKALQEVLPMLELLLQINGKPEEGSVGYKARAAIAKATGEQP